VQEHRYFNPQDDFLGLDNLLAFHPYRARELVTDTDKSDGFDFRVQKDRLCREGEETIDADGDGAKKSLDSDDFGILAVAAEAMQDAGEMRCCCPARLCHQ
jgi:hypothetical protein